MEKIAALKIERKELTVLIAHEKNPRKHPPKGSKEWEALKKSLLNDYFDPIVWNQRNGKLVSGHFRVKIMRDEGYTHADVVVVDYDEAMHVARMIAANQHAGSDDKDVLRELLGELTQTSASQLQEMTGMSSSLLEDLCRPVQTEAPPASPESKQTLAEKFGVTPLSVLDARQHYWKKRAEAWEEILNIELAFDPVLAELVMKWFLPAEGRVIDLGAKYPLRGLVAGHAGINYVGLADAGNAAANMALAETKKAVITVPPLWSAENEETAAFDLALIELPAFTSFKEAKEQIALLFSKAEGYLKPNRFFVVWIGKQQKMRDKSADSEALVATLSIEESDKRWTLLSESILLRPLGGTPMACRSFPATRRLARCHGTMLVFFRGETANIEREFPFPAMGDLSE